MRQGYSAHRGQEKPADGNAAAMPIEQAATWWARRCGSKKPHRSTLVRWAIRGCRGRRLRAELAGGRWYVSESALAEFHRHVNQLPARASDRSAGPARAVEIAAAFEELDSLIGSSVSCGQEAKA
jgi:hypothetical protein